jgi:hypothetical protein
VYERCQAHTGLIMTTSVMMSAETTGSRQHSIVGGALSSGKMEGNTCCWASTTERPFAALGTPERRWPNCLIACQSVMGESESLSDQAPVRQSQRWSETIGSMRRRAAVIVDHIHLHPGTVFKRLSHSSRMTDSLLFQWRKLFVLPALLQMPPNLLSSKEIHFLPPNF